MRKFRFRLKVGSIKNTKNDFKYVLSKYYNLQSKILDFSSMHKKVLLIFMTLYLAMEKCFEYAC